MTSGVQDPPHSLSRPAEHSGLLSAMREGNEERRGQGAVEDVDAAMHRRRFLQRQY